LACNEKKENKKGSCALCQASSAYREHASDEEQQYWKPAHGTQHHNIFSDYKRD
jgi:hypothetical protein